MKASILSKLERLQDRYEELEALLGVAEVIMDQDKFRAYSKEYAELENVVNNYGQYVQLQGDMEEAHLMLAEDDAEMKAMAEDEILHGKKRQAILELELQKLLLPKDPNDGHNTFVEIRAGTGGDEAAIFAGDLYRMYTRYAENMGWKVEIISQNEGEHGGYREIITRMVGNDVYSRLKFESGAHRVQRVPETESQGRIHTSALDGGDPDVLWPLCRGGGAAWSQADHAGLGVNSGHLERSFYENDTLVRRDIYIYIYIS